MKVPLVLLLLLAAISTTTALDPASYSPQVTTQPLIGKITASTFSLEQPLCIFDQAQNSDIWLLVAYTSAITNLSQQNTTISPYSSFKDKSFYTTLKSKATDYPCVDSVTSIRVLRVGENTACVNDLNVQDCNGPLPSSGPYSVKFLIQDPNTKAIKETRWSQPITLQRAKDPSLLDTFPGRRSGGMIVITSILSVLLAILLACLIAALIYGCHRFCWHKEIANRDHLPSEANRTQKYITHHMQAPM